MVYNYNLNMIIVNYWVKSISILLLMIRMLTCYSYVRIKQCSGTFFSLKLFNFMSEYLFI